MYADMAGAQVDNSVKKKKKGEWDQAQRYI